MLNRFMIPHHVLLENMVWYNEIGVEFRKWPHWYFWFSKINLISNNINRDTLSFSLMLHLCISVKERNTYVAITFTLTVYTCSFSISVRPLVLTPEMGSCSSMDCTLIWTFTTLSGGIPAGGCTDLSGLSPGNLRSMHPLSYPTG